MGRLAIGTLLILLLAACEEPLTSGRIVSKHYEPERTYVAFIPIVRRIGNTTYTQLYPYWHFDDEDFIIIIEDLMEDGETKQSRLYLPDRESWERVEIGAWWDPHPEALAFDELERRGRADG